MPAPEDDRSLLVHAARAAGALALKDAGEPVDFWEKPDGAGPVTATDLAVNAVLHETLRSARPDYGWLSEETEDDTDRLTRERVFIVDPIDGTRSFIEGGRTWAHALAVAERGVVTAAVVFVPRLDKLYSAAAGQGAWLNEVPIRTSQQAAMEGATMVAAKPNFAPEHWRDGRVPPMERTYRPSLAYRLSLVAEGRFDAMMVTRPTWEWDIAAGDLINREAGARISDRAAQPLIFNNPTPLLNGVVAANPTLHSAIAGSLVYGLPSGKGQDC